jgi:hypothetical protein
MAAPYQVTPITQYNLNPPADDGSQTEANRVKWATMKSKIGDPLKDGIDTNFAAIAAAFGKMPGGGESVTTATSYTVQSSNQGDVIIATQSGITITTPDATGVGAPFMFSVSNDSDGDVTLDGSGSQTIDGEETLTVPARKGLTLFSDGSNWRTIGRNWEIGSLPFGYLYGLAMSNAADTTNDITVAAGRCKDSSGEVDMIIGSAITKQLDASWVVGNNQGGRSSAGLADDTWHVHVIAKAFGLSADVLFHNAVDPSAVLPTDYLYYRRIGSIVRVSSAILQFVQDGDHFQLVTPVLDENNTGLSTSASTLTLESIPNGIRVLAEFNATLSTGSASAVYFSDLSTADLAPTLTPGGSAPGSSMGWTGAGVSGSLIHAQRHRIRTNTSRQIRARADSTRALSLYTLGWWDRRGREG